MAFQLRQGDAARPLELLDGVVVQQAFEVVDLLGTAGQHDSDAVDAIRVSDPDLHAAFAAWQQADAGSAVEFAAWEVVIAVAESVLYLQSGIKALILDVVIDGDSPQKFQLTIKLGNDAMQSPRDVVAALRAVADRLEVESFRFNDSGIIRDVNGNNVGSWGVR